MRVLSCVAVGLLLVGVTLGLRRLRFGRATTAVFLAGTVVRLAYLHVTPYSERSHDADQHLEYVSYILAHHAIPPPSAGWAFYHPPLYFLLAAALWRVVAAFHASQATLVAALQVQSLVYHLGFLAFGLLTGRRWIDRMPGAPLDANPRLRSRLGALYAALLCLWPSGIIHSVRVGNDDLLYLFFGAGLFFLTRWWQDRRERDLWITAALGALAMQAKSNGLLLFAILGALFVVRVVVDGERPWNLGRARRATAAMARRAWPAVAFFAASAGLTFVRAWRDAVHTHNHLLVGNADRLPAALTVGNGAANYLWFDLKMFVTQPYSSSWVDDAGRQYFLDFAMKTSLLGDFQFDGAWLSNLAVVLAALCTLLLACLLLGTARANKDDLLAELPLFLTVVVAVASLAALRMSIPKACSNDFRYIAPVTVPLVYLYVRALVRLREAGQGGKAGPLRLAQCGEAAGWAFGAASALFFVKLAMVAWP